MNLSHGKPLEISDKPLFNSYFKKFPPEISEFTFTNLFIWRNHYNFLFIEFNNHLIIFSFKYLEKHKECSIIKCPNTILFLPPIGPEPNKIILEIFNSFDYVEIHRVPENIINKLRTDLAIDKLSIEIKEDRNNWDYIYEKDSIMNLNGNRHRQNRRWLQRFLRNYTYEFNLLTEDCIERLRELQLELCLQKDCHEDESLIEEQRAINEAIDNFNQLDFIGGMLCVENKCVAYTFGEKLNNETLVIHIEKAHMQYEGSYQAINNLFLKNCGLDFKFVNREQDLGILGLKRAKESYKPVRMIIKSIIYKSI